MAALDRRDFLKGAAVVTGGLVAGVAPSGIWARPAAADTGSVRVYVVVVDGLRPDEVALMPQLSALAEAGTFYPQSRAQMVAETTPNHISMLTGMRSQRHGMPGNAVPFIPGRVSDDRRFLEADSVFTLARRQAPELRTVSVTAKSYLVESQKHDRTGDGQEDATATNTTLLNIPGSDSAPDVETGSEAVMRSEDIDPDFLFLNLGDVDRVGHVDETGTVADGTAPAGRTFVLQTADGQVRRLVESLKADDRWASTVFIITADHSMDWSLRNRNLNLQPAFEADELLAGEVVAAVNGGACMYALRTPNEPQAGRRLAQMRAIALDTEGIDEALYIRPNPDDGGSAHAVGTVHPDWGLVGDRTGDLIVTCEPGWRIGHSNVPTQSNPIPGNHGHPATLPIPIIVSGGWAGLAPASVVDPGREIGLTERDPGQAENIDMAPTVAWLLGLNPPPGGFDGRVLEEAFTERPRPRVEVRNIASVPVPRRLAGRDRFATAAVLSGVGSPAGAGGTVVIASGEDFTDALAATPLAIALGAPLLLSGRGALNAATAAEVRRLEAEDAIVIGGTAALSDEVIAGLVAAGVPADRIERISGPDRFQTAAAVATRLVEETGGPSTQRQAILVAGARRGGDAFPDALAAGVLAGAGARPILLTEPDGLPVMTGDALTRLAINRVIIAGGERVVPLAVEIELREQGRIVERISGADRYETGRLLAERHIREGGLTDDVYLVSGARFPDALAAGALVGAVRGTLLLTPPDGLGSSGTRAFLAERSDQLVRVNFVGGDGALSPRLEAEVGGLLAARRSRPS